VESKKSIELEGDHLLAAIVQALRKSYADLSSQVAAMTMSQLRDYLHKHPYVVVDEEACEDDAEQLRAAILANHEPQMPSEFDLLSVSHDDLWPLCEALIERYDIALAPRIEVASYRKVWLADDDELQVTGATPREAVLRFYVVTKLGAEVTLET
jgi:hypothetical protein